MVQKFSCKGPNCDKEVIFEYDPVKGVFMKIREKIKADAFLTCENGHCHKYTVEY